MPAILLFLLFFLPAIPCLPGEQPAVEVYFFYSMDCEDCADIKANLMPELEKTGRIVVHYHEITNHDNYMLLLDFEKKHGRAKNPPPTVYVGSRLLDGYSDVKANLENAVKDGASGPAAKLPAKAIESEKPTEAPPEPDPAPYGEILEKFKYIGAGSVVVAGLLDGINPCAFSTIIILVLYLTYSGYKRTDILKVGASFTAGVFLSYFIIGVGLLEFMRRIKIVPVIHTLLMLFIGMVSIILGFISLYDYYKIKQGKLKEIALQLPDAIKEKIKNLIWKTTKRRHFVMSTFIIGFLIGILEFPCTGQIYFPIVVVLREVPALRVHALGYLALYDLMFVVPLAVVFLLVFFSTTQAQLSRFLEERSGLVKLFTSFIFFLLGAIILLLKFA